jgi:hypothetical protein
MIRSASLINASHTGPSLIQPVARVGSCFSHLLGDGLVVLADFLEKSVALARLGNRNTMTIAEGLELTVGPSVQNPILDVGIGTMGLIFGLVPHTLDTIDERIPCILGRVLGLDALLLQIASEFLLVPVAVRLGNIGLPVLLHKVFEILAVGRGRVRDVVVGEPPLKLCLMPSVVRWM